jgi:hypothetical protein
MGSGGGTHDLGLAGAEPMTSGRRHGSAFIRGDMRRYVALINGEVGDYPAQEWSLRVTLVFRREGPEWRLAHRHADALVHPITFDQLAELARG